MPYGDLREQVWQRFETYADLDKHKCTIEEREAKKRGLDVRVVRMPKMNGDSDATRKIIARILEVFEK